jgi:hypothetical protein
MDLNNAFFFVFTFSNKFSGFIAHPRNFPEKPVYLLGTGESVQSCIGYEGPKSSR